MLQNVVDDRLCGESSALSHEQCVVACPGDCLLSDWSAWSHCSQSCGAARRGATGYRTRFRQILAGGTDKSTSVIQSINQELFYTPFTRGSTHEAHVFNIRRYQASSESARRVL